MSSSDLIAKVKDRPELWQSSHPFYRHRGFIAKTWKEIAAELKVDEIFVRKRWKHLKDTFRKEHKKVISKAIPLSFWGYYDKLNFLSDEMVRWSWRSADAEENDSDIKSNNNSDSDDAPLKAKRTKKSLTTPIGSSHKKSRIKAQEAAGTHNLITRNVDAGKLNFILNRVQAMEEVMENRNNLPEDTRKNNSDYMFLLSLLPLMKKLTEIQKLQFRGKMNDWLLDIVTQNEHSEQMD